MNKILTLFVLLFISQKSFAQYNTSIADSSFAKAAFKLTEAKRLAFAGRGLMVGGAALSTLSLLIPDKANAEVYQQPKYILSGVGVVLMVAGWINEGRAWRRIGEAGELLRMPSPSGFNFGIQENGIGLGFKF